MLALLRSPKVIGVALVVGVIGYQAIKLRIAQADITAMQAEKQMLIDNVQAAQNVAAANEKSLTDLINAAKQAEAAYQAQLKREREEGARLHGEITQLESLIADANSDCAIPAAVTERLRDTY